MELKKGVIPLGNFMIPSINFHQSEYNEMIWDTKIDNLNKWKAAEIEMKMLTDRVEATEKKVRLLEF